MPIQETWDVGSTLGLGRSSGGRNGNPLQYSCLENPMDRWVRWAAVHCVAKSHTQLSDFTFTFHFHALEKETATHSSVLAWRIPGTEEPGGLPSMGSHRVGHDWCDLASNSKEVFSYSQLWNDFAFLFKKKTPRVVWSEIPQNLNLSLLQDVQPSLPTLTFLKRLLNQAAHTLPTFAGSALVKCLEIQL